MIPSRIRFVTLAAVLALNAAAQQSIDQSRRTAIVTAIEQVSPAVVSINVIELRAQRQIPPRLRDFWDMFDLPGPYAVQQRRMNSVGSGFFYKEGYIITNFHVIEGADKVASVTLPDGRELEVTVAGVDERTDVAVLRATASSTPSVALGNSDDLLTGEWAIAIGNPFGPLMSDSQPTVSVGVVSANHRRINPRVGGGERLYQGMIQTDAAINPGNSGGPLVNSRGQVIGINTMIFSESGGSVGLGFAIPINRAKRVAEEIIQYGRRRDPWTGFKVEDVASLSAGAIAQLGISSPSGCVIQNILRDCPAYAAGLRPGDVVIGVNGQRVQSSSDIDFAVWDLFVGDPIAVSAERSGQVLEFKFQIQELAK
ncbi:MAG: trypsin-like peptidase domain-containing protein [Candidatus Hydrogenedentales bacterium]|jgi:serine protease Do